MELVKHNSFTIKPLGKKKIDVYDIETADNHNFFANNILVHNSNYLTLEEVVEKLKLNFKSHKEFADWAKQFLDEVLQPVIDEALENYAYEFGFENIIKFQREKIISEMFVVAGKNYALNVVEDEDGNQYFDEPKTKITGIPVKKKTAQKIAQEHLPHVLDMIMTHQPKDKILEYLRPVKSEYMNGKLSDDDFDNIFIAGRVNDIEKYQFPFNVMDEKGFIYKSRATFKVKGAINHNYIIHKEKLDSVFPLVSGEMCKSAYILPNNKFGITEISWENKYPKEFKNMFQIDKTKMWDKAIVSMITKWFDVAKLGGFSLERDNKINSFLGF
jgi:hypothetical protein